MGSIQVRPLALSDLLNTAEYLQDEGGDALSKRFLSATQRTFEILSSMPKLGALCGFTHPRAENLRRWPVKGFENWQVFYLPVSGGVEIVHVVHGARDIEELFDVQRV